MELRGIASGASMNTIHRYRRFDGWDYSRGASFFITIATAPRRALFGRVRGGGVVLSALGRKVDEALLAMPRLNPGLSIFGRVVMPDHVHFNCALAPGLKEPLKVLGFAVRRFKNYTTKLAKSASLASLAEHSSAIKSGVAGISATASGAADCQAIGFNDAVNNRFDGQTALGQSGQSGLWQQGYHDYLLLSRAMIDSTERYIAYNPQKWELMYGEEGCLRVIEPLSSPRLYIGDYWKGVGNVGLLSPMQKLVSLRVSREVSSPDAIYRVVKRMENAVEKGYAVISGFISKGERAVRDMLCLRNDARFIRVLPSCIPNRRFRPESVYVAPFAENRYLEIAKGNDEVEFSRRACLDLNSEITEIATSGAGLALYWKAAGLQVLCQSPAHTLHS